MHMHVYAYTYAYMWRMPELDEVIAEGGARGGGRVALGFVHAWLEVRVRVGVRVRVRVGARLGLG